jgi:hypothetical protein
LLFRQDSWLPAAGRGCIGGAIHPRIALPAGDLVLLSRDGRMPTGIGAAAGAVAVVAAAAVAGVTRRWLAGVRADRAWQAEWRAVEKEERRDA